MNPFATSRVGRVGPWLGIAPGLLLFLTFALIPAVAVVGMSFTDISGMPNVPWTWVGLDNYRRFFSAGSVAANLDVVNRTLIFALSVTIILNVLALLLAVLLSGRLRGAALYRSIVFMPVVLGVTIVGLIWSLVFNPTGGPAASLWSSFGSSSSFLGDPKLAFTLIIFVQIWAAIGTTMMIYHAGLMAIPSDLYEAARVDGANAWHKLRHVTIPMVAPAITANMVISIVGSLQTYQIIYVLTGDRPTTSVLALKVFSIGFGTSEQGYAAAVSMIQFVLVAVIALVLLSYLRRRETQL
ncbi:carbohydrate ABC transporter permease [Jiangella muralis]|uniref:carbohydrate ABC transporter permease n=1 Tax=Jiangella muralis TaxID=702383 RepID=UPI001969BB86|nr:sugar ABC transporter permease [Jiangella muralis]